MNNKISFFYKEENIIKTKALEKKLDISNRPYYLSIKKINLDFLYDAVNLIYNLQSLYKQPFMLTKNTIKNILKNFLPYNFFLCLSAQEAFKLKKELYENEDFDFFLVAKKREEKGMSIFTYTNNFYNLNLEFYNNNNNVNHVLDFFKDYLQFYEKNYLHKPNIDEKGIIDLFGNYPVVLFDNLSLQEAILIVNYFNNKHPLIPIDLMMAETRIMMKKNKVKWTK